jgi:biopolymer transport protein ExbD
MNRPAPGVHGVNLMPLLDVLLCTMGTLIVILGVINREARLHPAKRSPAKAALAEQQQQMIDTKEDLQLRIQELTTAQQKTQADLTTERTRLAGVEQSSREMEDHLDSLAAAAKQIPVAGAADDPQRDQLRLKLMQLNTQRLQMERDLERARADSANRQPAYAVIPFEGMYKTNRRPIYIECRGDSVILQPEGIVFTPQDFLGPGGPSNPLASALRAAQEYWRNAPRPAPDMPNEPYPLLLVRPDGIIAYYLVRDAMSSWDAEFGYELVGQDWKLDFPMQPEAQLKEQEERAVAEARQQLQWLAQVSPELFSRKASKVQYHVSPFRGGVVRDGGPSLGNDPFANDPLGGFGRSGGNGNSAIPGVGDGPATGGTPGSGPGGYGNGVSGQPGGTQLADARGNSAFAVGGNGSGSSGTGNSELGGNGLAGSGVENNRWGPGGVGTSSGAGSGGGVGGENGGAGGPNLTGGSGAGLNVGARYAGNGIGGTEFGNGTQNSNSGNSTANGNAGNGAGQGLASPGQNQPVASGAANGMTGMPGNGGGSPSEYGGVLLPNSQPGVAGGQDSMSRGPGLPAGDSVPGSPGGQYASAGGATGEYANGNASSFGGSAASGSTASSACGGGSTILGSPMGDPNATTGSLMGSFGAPPMQQNTKLYDDTQQQQQQQSSFSQSFARKRGKNWAVDGSQKTSMPIDRPVRVECFSDRLVLMPDTHDQQPQVIPLSARTDDAIDPLVGAIRTYTKSWGIAGRSMYWKPQLVLNVNPGAERRAADLQVLLADSGWDVKRK